MKIAIVTKGLIEVGTMLIQRRLPKRVVKMFVKMAYINIAMWMAVALAGILIMNLHQEQDIMFQSAESATFAAIFVAMGLNAAILWVNSGSDKS